MERCPIPRQRDTIPVDGSNGEYAKAAIIRLCYSLLLKVAPKKTIHTVKLMEKNSTDSFLR